MDKNYGPQYTGFCKKCTRLAHVMSQQGVRTDLGKLNQVASWTQGEDDDRSFIGRVSYYERFVADVVDTAAPLHRLLKKPIRQTDKCD